MAMNQQEDVVYLHPRLEFWT